MSVVDRIATAVRDVLSLQEQGQTASKAMCKVAQSLDLSPEMIKRASSVLNRSQLNSQRLYGESLRDKLADIEAVDPDAVIREVYGLESKAASSPSPSQQLAGEILAKLPPQEAKVASAPPTTEQRKEGGDRLLPEHASRGMYHGLKGVELYRTLRGLEEKKTAAQWEIKKLSASAARDLRHLELKLASLTRQEQLEVVNQGRYALHREDPGAKQILLHLADNLPVETQAKIAAVPETPDVWSSAWKQFEPHVKKLAADLRSYAERHQAEAKKIASSDAHRELITESLVDGVVQRLGVNPAGWSFRELDEAWLERKTADLWSAIGFGLAGKKDTGAKHRPAPSDAERFMLELRNPQHEAALASVRARSALQELLATDPVISGYKPQDVVKQFNELSSYSPQAVENTAALRAALRQSLSNNTSLFDLDQLRRTEREREGKRDVLQI